MCLRARTAGLPLIRDIFTEAPHLSYFSFGFNVLNSKERNDEAIACMTLLQTSATFPQENRALLQEIDYISTC